MSCKFDVLVVPVQLDAGVLVVAITIGELVSKRLACELVGHALPLRVLEFNAGLMVRILRLALPLDCNTGYWQSRFRVQQRRHGFDNEHFVLAIRQFRQDLTRGGIEMWVIRSEEQTVVACGLLLPVLDPPEIEPINDHLTAEVAANQHRLCF